MFLFLALTISIINIIPLFIIIIQKKNIIDFYKRNLQLITNPILSFIIFYILGKVFSLNNSYDTEQTWLLIVSGGAVGASLFDGIQGVYKLLKK